MNGGKGGDDELFGLFAMSAKVLARCGDAAAFLDWIARHGPGFAPEMARGIDPRTGPPGLAFRAMGVAIYNAMPLPEAGFQSRRLPEPGRNEPCLCGSGRKHKHCCLRLRGILDLTGFNMLRHILDSAPKKRFAELPGSRVDPLAVADTARQWHEEGDDERAATASCGFPPCSAARRSSPTGATSKARGAASARRSARTPRIRTWRRSSSPCWCRAARPGKRGSARGSGSRGWSAGAIRTSRI